MLDAHDLGAEIRENGLVTRAERNKVMETSTDITEVKEFEERGKMPPPSPGKYRGPAIRQLSLQNPTPLQSPSRGLKKQLSEDEGRVLRSVEVTGQGWNVGGERTQIRVNSGSGKTKIGGTRPKPVKVAWADKKPESPELPSGVEVIATKCQGQPRPTSLKTQRLRSPLLGNKDTLVYTRLQLAERLRNAWSEREKIKPNINIFLGHAPDTTRSENDDTEAVTLQDAASALSDPSAPLDKKRKPMPVLAFTRELSDLKSQDMMVPDHADEDELTEIGEGSPRNEENEFPGRHLQELNKIEIRMTKIQGEAEGRENKPPDPEEVSVGVKRCRDKDSESSSEGKTDSKAVEPPPVTAQDRRANFRRSSLLNKTISESFCSGNEEKDNKIVTKPPQKQPPLIRAFSAPSQNDQISNASLQKKVRTAPQRRLQPTVSFDIPSTNTDSPRTKERIKSAPVRRRLKSAASRRKGKDKDSSDEEKEVKDSGAATKKAAFKRSQLKKGGDIVTMVSLVSPSESDTEDSVINLPMESWTGGERAEAPQNASASSENAEESKESPPVQKFVSLRKTTKSVTFHPHPILSRSYSANFPSRRAPAGTPIIVPTPVVSNPALTPAQLLERDKRTPPLCITFAPLDGRGIKRKLLKSSTVSTKGDDSSEEKGIENAVISDNLEGGKEEDDVGEEKVNGEPEFKCPKERECWNLYQKMTQKGVSVSFDTVLRGMLTPTEYRLRKNRLLLNC